MAIIKPDKKHFVVITAYKDSLKPDLSFLDNYGIRRASTSLNLIGNFMFKALSPYENKNILVFYGREGGILPRFSEIALKLYEEDADMIFCCFPKQMRQKTGDRRIQWTDCDKELWGKIQETKNHLIITIGE